MMPAAEIQVRSGYAMVWRLYDFAYAIDLQAAQTCWARHANLASTRSGLRATPAKAVAYDVPPLILTLDALPLTVSGQKMTAEVTARLYDFGVVTLSARIPLNDLSWARYTDTVNALDECLRGQAQHDVRVQRLDYLRTVLMEALDRPTVGNRLEEDYLVACVQQWDQPMSAETMGERLDLVPLLTGERQVLADSARADLLRARFSYYSDDLAVLTWDRAFICDPRANSDIADVLEIANAQLLELRYYDELLDREMPLMHDLVEETHRAAFLLAPGRYSRLARKLYALVAEVTELKEKLDNALQVTEDVYLARIYAAALGLYRVPEVESAVDRKLAIIRDTYAALYDEASVSRSELMELTIILLIVIEIVLAFVRH